MADGAELELLPVSSSDRSLAMRSVSSSSFGASLLESSFMRSSQCMGSYSLPESLPDLAKAEGSEEIGERKERRPEGSGECERTGRSGFLWGQWWRQHGP